ncbi:hypothetical protein ABZ547_22155 [Streptomyces sparsogenes]|uniref:hypothetical protein n=1 Tax=Streptomyces sparsogenes TaxID=67365 RepID=UPI0033D57E96
MSDDALVTHCPAFCAALTSHHQGEDEGCSPSCCANDRISQRRREPCRGSRNDRFSDGLAAIMESYFTYEERTISEALDGGVPDTDWPDLVFRFGMA